MSRWYPLVIVTAVALCSIAVIDRVSAQDEHELLKKADVIAQRVVKLRGLQQKRPIARGVMQKDEIRQRLLKRIDEEYTADELAAEELALKRLGLLPEDTNYKKLVIELLTDQIAGFYDPAEQRLYIAGWQRGSLAAMDEMLMAHEIDHALQDQHFDLRTFMKPGSDNADAAVARQALVEGDGTALMVEYMFRDVKTSPWKDDTIVKMMKSQAYRNAGEDLDKAPMVLREGLLFPYLRGLTFVAHFRQKHPWSYIDSIFRKPPLSTEQILHPDKYVSYEEPDTVEAQSIAALAGYRAVFENITGEFGLSVLLRQHSGRQGRKGDKKRARAIQAKAEQATAGWGGDRMVVYTPAGKEYQVANSIAVSYSVWDETADAIEFFEMLSDSMASFSGGKSVARRTTAGEVTYVEYKGDHQRRFVAQRKGDAVLLVVGAPANQTKDIVTQVWAGWKVRRR